MICDLKTKAFQPKAFLRAVQSSIRKWPERQRGAKIICKVEVLNFDLFILTKVKMLWWDHEAKKKETQRVNESNSKTSLSSKYNKYKTALNKYQTKINKYKKYKSVLKNLQNLLI